MRIRFVVRFVAACGLATLICWMGSGASLWAGQAGDVAKPARPEVNVVEGGE